MGVAGVIISASWLTLFSAFSPSPLLPFQESFMECAYLFDDDGSQVPPLHTHTPYVHTYTRIHTTLTVHIMCGGQNKWW